MTMADTDAVEAMRAHHQELEDGVDRRVGAVHAAVGVGDVHEAAVAELVAYMAESVLPHALAEEQSLYEAARRLPRLDETVTGMVDEHRQLVSSLEQLARAEGPVEAAEIAASIGALFKVHVGKENDLLLPALTDAGTPGPGVLLEEMRRSLESLSAGAAAATDTAEVDGEADLLGLLLEASNGLAEAGRGDQACRVVANAWALLRRSRPDLAVRLTAVLHRLVRSVVSQPVSLSAHPGSGPSPSDQVLDVRSLAPAQRHESIFATYAALRPTTAFVLVNDHDPKPLRYQFEAEHPGEFTWEAIEEGPTTWRVRIGRVGGGGAPGAGQEVTPELDVRTMPHGARHDSIFAAFAALAPGAGFVLVNDHDPRPLRYQFEAQHAGGYSWEYVEAGPRVWRVRIGRPVGAPA